MHLTMSRWFTHTHLEYCGVTKQRADQQTRRFALLFSALLMLATAPAVRAEPASPPAYDPRQFDQRFNGEQTERTPVEPPRLPRLARPATPPADPTPLFVLHQISIVGAA